MSKETLYCYTRVSTQEQETDGNSLIVQKDWGKKVADKLGMNCGSYNEGARSSTTQIRPILSLLEEDIRKGKVKHLWVLDQSRIFRSLVDWGIFCADYLIPQKVTVYMGTFGESYDLQNDDTLMILDIVARVKENQNKKSAEKSRLGKLYKLENDSPSKPIFLGGTPLFGYISKDKLWTINKNESKWVKYIFETYDKGNSSKDIKDKLDREGVKPRRTKDGFWSLGTLQDMLRNNSYTGEHLVWEYERVTAYEYEKNKEDKDNYKKIGKIFKKKVRPFTYAIPRIINKGLYNRVQKEMDKRLVFQPHPSKHFSLLQNILVCECGNNFGSRVDVRKKTDGTEINTRKYMCPAVGYDWKKTGVRTCVNVKSLQMDLLNDYVLNYVKNRVSKSHLLKDKFKKDIMEEHSKKMSNLKDNEKFLENKVQSIVLQIDNMENQIVELEFDVRSGKMDSKRGEGIIKKFQNELDIKQQEKNEIEKEIDDVGKDRNWLNWVEKFGDTIKLNTADETKQKEFLKGILNKVTVNSEYDNKDKQQGHSFDFQFKMKIIDDKFEWIDKTVLPRTYKVKDGRDYDKSDGIIKFVVTRNNSKKKVLKKGSQSNSANERNQSQ